MILFKNIFFFFIKEIYCFEARKTGDLFYCNYTLVNAQLYV